MEKLDTLGTRMGAILDDTGSYLGVQLYSGVSIGATGVLLLFAGMSKKD
ncbi:MFS monocarboxylate transporter [Aspergillus luchuensis]|uniref:MFS monocarboxylate transporter n=1 Tax=Aspergillus kawachii TaxID=1069201 RepID=A0A146FRA4_ASPKA|nr:MFS monocarboxylate transporter [Aspergillus luchuensis]